jgi:hypothetical protein
MPTVRKSLDMTGMSESLRAPDGDFGPKCARFLGSGAVAHRVHEIRAVLFGLTLFLVAFVAACVVPPPLEVDTADAAPNSPPNITQVRDSAANSLRPPATLTVNTAGVAADVDLTLYDPDADDELTVQLFVNYNPLSPLDARAEFSVPPAADGSSTRSTRATTAGLCTDIPTGTPQRLEIEVYDRAPADITPYREPGPGGFFTTWTLDLICTNTP